MASYVGSGTTINSSASLSSYTTGTNGGSNYTVGSGANRALFIAVHGYLDASANAAGCSSVTHNGQAATLISVTPKVSRTWQEIWYVLAPTTGAGGTTVVTTALQRALRVAVLEAIDVDQTTPVHAISTSYNSATGTSKTFSLTTHADNALLIAAVAVQSGAGAFSASDGGTLAQSGQTGTLGTNDVSGGLSYEAVATASAETSTISWTTGDNNAGLMIEVQNAAANGYTLTAATGSFTETGNATGLRATRMIGATVGTYATTGTAAGLPVARRLTAAAGAVALTGINAGLRAARLIGAATSSYALTGVDAGLIRAGAKVILAAAGAFVVAGNAATLRVARRLAAQTSAYGLTGQSGGLRAARQFSASAASFVLAGPATLLRAARKTAATVGTFALTGNAAALTQSGGAAINTRFAIPGDPANGGALGQSANGGTLSNSINSGALSRG